MNNLVNSTEMKACDMYTMEQYCVPSLLLMEHAAQSFVEELINCSCNMEHIGIVCGYGNNGGDGLAVARMLYLSGYETEVWMIGTKEHATAQTKTQLEMVKNYGIRLHRQEEPDFSRCTLLVDAIFGVGLSREVTGIYARTIQSMNERGVFVAAADIPSGINADDGQVLGCAVRADVTITFAFKKVGHVLYPGAEYSGQVIVKDIGIGTEGMGGRADAFTCDCADIAGMLPARSEYSNKGTYGKVVLVMGSRGMSGAAYLAGIAAYRMGCGLVRILTPEENRTVLQQLLPEAVLTTYDVENPDMAEIQTILNSASCIGIGSGLGQSATSMRLLQEVMEHDKIPVVVDGDGLRLLSARPELLAGKRNNLIITPHLGEMSGLLCRPVAEIQHKLVQTAKEVSNRYGICCVLKDARTVVVCEEEPVYINTTGNHGMATAGSGDVLAGMLCSLLAQGTDCYHAAVAAVYLHGMAGDMAACAVGISGMMAHDIVNHISKAMQDVEA